MIVHHNTVISQDFGEKDEKCTSGFVQFQKVELRGSYLIGKPKAYSSDIATWQQRLRIETTV